MSSLFYIPTKDDLPRDPASDALVARALMDIVELDSRLEKELAKYGSPKDFHVALWRQEADATGCNWNARIERIGAGFSDPSWWGVVPRMRERFNLM
jgi:hypothetical protein